jgi:hypothetical protein
VPRTRWIPAARAFAPNLDKLNAVIVLGRQEFEPMQVALGLARQQARRRRVTVCDLLDDSQPIAALAPSEGPHGLADGFDDGVSVEKGIRPLEGEPNIAVRPMGAFVSDPAEIMGHRRWTSLAAEFRDRHGLDARDVASAEEAVKGAELVVAAVKSTEPVLEGRWLEPGVNVVSVGTARRDHLGDRTGEVEDWLPVHMGRRRLLLVRCGGRRRALPVDIRRLARPRNVQRHSRHALDDRRRRADDLLARALHPAVWQRPLRRRPRQVEGPRVNAAGPGAT